MKGIAGMILIGFATAATPQVNSGSADLNNVIEMVRSISQLERKEVVTEELAMTNAESVAFWPVYEAYSADLRAVDDRLLQLILDYAATYDNVSDEMARNMVDDYLDIEMDRLKVRSRYVRKFDDVLPPKTLARFVQIENKMNVIAQLYLAEEIPLIQ